MGASLARQARDVSGRTTTLPSRMRSITTRRVASAPRSDQPGSRRLASRRLGEQGFGARRIHRDADAAVVHVGEDELTRRCRSGRGNQRAAQAGSAAISSPWRGSDEMHHPDQFLGLDIALQTALFEQREGFGEATAFIGGLGIGGRR